MPTECPNRLPQNPRTTQRSSRGRTEEEAYILSRDYSVCGREEKMPRGFNVDGNNESKVKEEQGKGERERKEQRVAPAPGGSRDGQAGGRFSLPQERG